MQTFASPWELFIWRADVFEDLIIKIKRLLFMMKKTAIAFAIFTEFTLPLFASAQNATGDLTGFVMMIGTIVNILVPLVSTLAIVFFFYGLAKYVLNSGDEDKQEEGKNIMIWGVLAMFVLVCIWGIIGFFARSGGFEQGPVIAPIDLPDVVPSNISGSSIP